MNERIPFDLSFGFAPSASEIKRSTVATKASFAANQAPIAAKVIIPPGNYVTIYFLISFRTLFAAAASLS